jgi:hypothetical protein
VEITLAWDVGREDVSFVRAESLMSMFHFTLKDQFLLIFIN